MSADEITRILDELGRRIGPYGEAAWTILVRQKAVEGVVWTVALSLAILAIVVASVAASVVAARLYRAAKVRHEARKGERYYYDSSPDAFYYLFPLGMALAFAATGVFVLGGTLVGFLLQVANPEYYAIRDLLMAVQ